MAFQMDGIYLEEYGYTIYRAAMDISNAINPTVADLKFNYYVLQQLLWVVVILLIGSVIFLGPWAWPTEDSATIEWLEEIVEEKGPTYEKFFASKGSDRVPTPAEKAAAAARAEALSGLKKTLTKKKASEGNNDEPSQTNYAEPRFPLWAVGVGAGTLALAQLSLFIFGSYSGLGSSL